jgi:endonuclease YncB( thermonuclease family)
MFLATRNLAFVAAGFLAGLGAAVLVLPVSASRAPAPQASAARTAPLRLGGHPAEVLRVIDGDTFEARVRVWPGTDITTKVRVRGIDAPEMHARCEDERTKAAAAREGLTQILAEGSVGVGRVTLDKYGGRVDADVSTATTESVSAAMLARGLARAYAGGRRASWCG